MTKDSVNIVAVGDIFLGESSLNIGRGVTTAIKNNGSAYYIKHIKSIIDNHDICFGNLETILSNTGRNIFDVSTIEMRGAISALSILTESGFNILNIANNHIFQHGMAPYEDTISRLQKKGIEVIGNKSDNLQVFDYEKIKIGFVGYSLHYEQYHPNDSIPYAFKNHYNEILDEIQTVRKTFKGILICSLHWGFEFLEDVSCEQRAFCHKLVDNGVSIILGHHPHVLQPIEQYKNAIIAYSLGNFIFDMNFDFTKISLALSVTICSTGITDFDFIPFRIAQNYCPTKLRCKELKKFNEKFKKFNEKFKNNNCKTDIELEKMATQKYNQLSHYNYIDFFKKIHTGNLYYKFLIILRALLRRIGIINNP